MGGIAMWIILGGLILIVVIFLIVTTILDRKKAKKLKIEKEQLLIKTKNAIPKIVEKISLIINSNNTKLKKFIPSVGKIKMYNINQDAKNALVSIKNSKNFKLIKSNEILHKKIESHILNLINSKSNNWNKRNQEDLHFFLNYNEIEKQIIIKQEKESKKELEKSKSKKRKIHFSFIRTKNRVEKDE